MPEAVTSLLQTGGVLAPILLLFGWYILQKDKREKELHAKLMEVQEKRIADAQRVAERIIEISERFADAMQESARSFDELRLLFSQFRSEIIHRAKEG